MPGEKIVNINQKYDLEAIMNYFYTLYNLLNNHLNSSTILEILENDTKRKKIDVIKFRFYKIERNRFPNTTTI